MRRLLLSRIQGVFASGDLARALDWAIQFSANPLSHKIDILWDSWYFPEKGEFMAEGVNVRFAGELQRFIRSRVEASGLYNSTSEYLRDLVRRDYEKEEAMKWDSLRAELKAGMEADRSEFVPLDIEKIISTVKKREKANGR